jgi:hypothetical protein
MRANELGKFVTEYYLYSKLGFSLLHLSTFFQLNYTTTYILVQYCSQIW